MMTDHHVLKLKVSPVLRIMIQDGIFYFVCILGEISLLRQPTCTEGVL